MLAFCLFAKGDYVEGVGQALQRLKLRFWGHDEQVLHEHEIRKPNKNYGFLFDQAKRTEFLDAVSKLVDEATFQLVAAVIRKLEFSKHYVLPANPCDLALEFGLERIFLELNSRGQTGNITHIIVEKRGEKEDNQLEVAFRRICAGANALNQRLSFELAVIPKASNSTVLQIADLVARSVGIRVLRPMQPNRAYNIVAKKFDSQPFQPHWFAVVALAKTAHFSSNSAIMRIAGKFILDDEIADGHATIQSWKLYVCPAYPALSKSADWSKRWLIGIGGSGVNARESIY